MSTKRKIRDLQTDCSMFEIYLVEPEKNEEFKIPYILAIPEKVKENCKLIVKTNDREKFINNEPIDYKTKIGKDFLIEDAINKLIGNRNNFGEIEYIKTLNAPMIIPVIPAMPNDNPYFQQLSKECFEINDKKSKFYRIDMQVTKIIENAKKIIESKGTKLADKIFLYGYSTSGVFCQRFAFLHPEIIDTVLVGNVGGTIPMPSDCEKSKELEYPIGTKNIEQLTGNSFDIENYKKIKFRYYLADLNNFNNIQQKDNLQKYDMSYDTRCMPNDLGIKLRKIYGTNLLKRFENQIKEYEKHNYNIETELYKEKKYNSRITKQEYEKIYNGIEFSTKSKFIKKARRIEYINMCIQKIKRIIKKFRRIGTIEIPVGNANSKSEIFKENLRGLNEEFERKINEGELSDKIEYINNKANSKLVNGEQSIYDFPLKTKLTTNQTIELTKKFFELTDKEMYDKVVEIISGQAKDDTKQFIELQMYPYEENLKYYNTKYDKNAKKYDTRRIQAQTELPQFGSNDLMIYVPLKGDLRDLYAMVHEITHSFDTKNGDTDARKILGEIAPQVMERLLDEFLLNLSDKEKITYGIDAETLKKDIMQRRITTFIDRYNCAKNITENKGKKIKNTRYMLAQIYQAYFDKYPNIERTEKLKQFIKLIENNQLDEANKLIGIKIDNHWYQDMYVSFAIKEFKESIGEQNTSKSNEDNSDLVKVEEFEK